MSHVSNPLPGSPIASKSSSRRAFALDSRTVWVEQQIVMNGIVSKDNLFVSPMDYDPRLPERHVPTTTIARPRTVDTFHPYRGNSGGTRSLKQRGTTPNQLLNKPFKKKSAYTEPLGDIRGTLGASSRTEFVSPFADHDKRMPLDPSRRYYITDKPALPADPFLSPHIHSDGPRHPDMGGSYICQENSGRSAVTPAHPQSDSVYNPDPPSAKKRIILGKFMPESVVSKGYKNEKATKSSREIKQGSDLDSPSRVKERVVVDRPPVRTRTQPVERYDSSCYRLQRKEGGVNMTPALSRSKAKVGVFRGMITHRLDYKSKPIESPLAERVRRNYM